MEYPEDVIRVADACYEMYLLEELEDISFMVEELEKNAPHLSPSQNKEAIYLAQHWKFIEKKRNYLPH